MKMIDGVHGATAVAAAFAAAGTTDLTEENEALALLNTAAETIQRREIASWVAILTPFSGLCWEAGKRLERDEVYKT